MTLPDLDATLATLRARGVSRYRDVPGEGFEVTFFPVQPAPEPQQATAQAANADLCVCDHPLFAHVNGLCVEGCEPEQCEKKKA